MVLEVLKETFSVCKVKDYSCVDLNAKYCFTGKTDRERSLVCPSGDVPPNVLCRDDGWRCFRVKGTLEFSLTGILSGIASVLAEAKVPLFAVSTFDTDYVLVKETDLGSALNVLTHAGYEIVR